MALALSICLSLFINFYLILRAKYPNNIFVWKLINSAIIGFMTTFFYILIAKPFLSNVSHWILLSMIIIVSSIHFMNGGGESTIEIEGIDVIMGGELEINDAPTSQEAGPSTPTPTTPVTETEVFDQPSNFQCYRDAKVSGPYVDEMHKSGFPWVVHGYQKPKIIFANGQICDARHFLKAATPAQLRELHTLGFSRCVGQEFSTIGRTRKAFVDLVDEVGQSSQ